VIETAHSLVEPAQILIEPIVRAALLEDLGGAGDLTTDAIAPAGATLRVAVAARKAGRLAGLSAALCAFTFLDPAANIERHARDGEDVGAGQTVAVITGKARAILSAERTALNLLSRTSGVASATAGLVALIHGTKSHIVCTRKTTPGLRLIEKYAVRCGGGANHRFGLDDAVLIKDNHIALAGNVREAIRRVRAHVGHLVKIEIEVDTLKQAEEALTLPIDAILFDNMAPEELRTGIALVAGRLITETSGSVDATSVRALAETGVDLISVGWITHSAPALDFGLDA
jgi:nicotinate-nucleotide pyrophosphorylase (carboxylating)